MTFNLDEAIKQLSKRGTDVVKSESNGRLKIAEENLFLKFGRDFWNVYSIIDGFTSHDSKSQLVLWSIRTISDNKMSYPVIIDGSGIKWLPIGDFLIDSDIVVAAVESENATTKLLYDNHVLSSSITDFVCGIADGKYDF